MSKFGKGASFFRVRQGLQSLNPALLKLYRDVQFLMEVGIKFNVALYDAVKR